MFTVEIENLETNQILKITDVIEISSFFGDAYAIKTVNSEKMYYTEEYSLYKVY